MVGGSVNLEEEGQEFRCHENVEPILGKMLTHWGLSPNISPGYNHHGPSWNLPAFPPEEARYENEAGSLDAKCQAVVHS